MVGLAEGCIHEQNDADLLGKVREHCCIDPRIVAAVADPRTVVLRSPEEPRVSVRRRKVLGPIRIVELEAQHFLGAAGVEDA